MIQLPPKAAILLWYGLDSSTLCKGDDLAYAVMTLDRALEDQIPDWEEWDIIEAPIDNIIKEIRSQRAVPLPPSDCDGMVQIPWTQDQLDSLTGKIK